MSSHSWKLLTIHLLKDIKRQETPIYNLIFARRLMTDTRKILLHGMVSLNSESTPWADLLIFPIPKYLKLGYGLDIELERKELMYLPNKFHCQDRKAIQSLMERYPLSTLVTIVDGSPIISHLPLVVEAHSTGNMVLLRHMPKANPHSRHIANSETTIIFQGPNS